MDLGLRGRQAIVCAASRGLGRACAFALAREGVELVITARTQADLDQAAEDIRAQTGVSVVAVAGDIATGAGRAAALAACPAPDILVTNAGGPPHGDFRDWTRDQWIAAIDQNMLAPIFLIRAVVDGMCDRGFGRIVNITSSSVKAPIPNLGLSNAARAGLTGFVAGLARQVARFNVTINNLLPGSIMTDRMRDGVAHIARERGITPEAALAESVRVVPAGRPGLPEEFGDACAFLCAAGSGFIVGHNLLVDGGRFNSAIG